MEKIYKVKLRAKSNIKKGDIVVCLWVNYCRVAKASDAKLLGFSLQNVKIGDYLNNVIDIGYITIKNI